MAYRRRRTVFCGGVRKLNVH